MSSSPPAVPEARGLLSGAAILFAARVAGTALALWQAVLIAS